ncbi:hypothetical protein [Lysinibacillus endophyticus]|nr:hypothetical protein [Lysinibacillus endophyticus]MCP1146568.1 hypothetical protein [Lysinibacillus endophyticus]
MNLKKKWIVFFGVIIILIAGILDIKFQGLFFQMLPESMQSFLSDLF